METKRNELTMAKNIFISFLGTGHYKECQYRCLDGNKRKVTFIQEATLDYLLSQKKFDSNSIAYILLTEKARKCNWDDEGEFELEDGTVETQEEGLNSRLEKLKKKYAKQNITFSFKDIDVSDESEKNIWILFTDLYNLLVKEEQESDINLYVDITHSFRYLPMFLIVFINYVKLFKNLTVAHISYGNYEGRDKKTNVAPIVELTDYSKLQDWTYAVRTYTESGNVKSLEKLLSKSDSDLFDAIKNVSLDFSLCRGRNIISGIHIAALKKEVQDFKRKRAGQPDIAQLSHLIDAIQKEIKNFKGSRDVKNGIEAAKWCYNKGLYQQAVTILDETIKLGDKTDFYEDFNTDYNQQKFATPKNSTTKIRNNINHADLILSEAIETDDLLQEFKILFEEKM